MIICIFSISNSIFVSPSFGTIPKDGDTNPVNVSHSSVNVTPIASSISLNRILPKNPDNVIAT